MAKNNTILIIEDDPNMGFLLKEFLTANDFKVILCSNGDCGLAAFASSKIDFCIIDVMLPGIDGFTIAERIRNDDKSIPIIFLSLII